MVNQYKIQNGLVVEGFTADATVLDIQGTQGQLFSITDSLTGDIFAVSDISGIPIFKVNSNGTITMDTPADAGATDDILRITSTGTIVASSVAELIGDASYWDKTGTKLTPSTSGDLVSLGVTIGDRILLYDNGGSIQYGFGIQSNLLQIYADASTDRIGLGYGTSTSFTETLTVKSNKVGIGISTPSTSLHVVGDGLVVDSGFNAGVASLYLSHTGTSNQHKSAIFTTYVSGYGRSSSMQFAFNSEMDSSIVTTNDAKMTLLENGNLGIGFTAPLSKLSINGGLHVGGESDAGDNNLLVDGDVTVAGGNISITNNNGGIDFNDANGYWLRTATNWGLYWNTSSNTLGFHGAGTERGYIDLDNGNLQMDGSGTFGGDVTVLNGYRVYAGAFRVVAASPHTSFLLTSAPGTIRTLNVQKLVNPSGYTEIARFAYGSATEAAGTTILNIASTGITLTSGVTVNNIATTVGATGTDTALVTEQGIREAIAASSCLWSTATGGIHYSSGNVGIGTATTTAKLQVAGTVYLYASVTHDMSLRLTEDELQISAVNNTTEFEANYVFQSHLLQWELIDNIGGSSAELSLEPDLFKVSATTIELATVGSTRFLIKEGGNVGIGTATPAKALDVIGNGRFSESLQGKTLLTNTGGHIAVLSSALITEPRYFEYPNANGTLALRNDLATAGNGLTGNGNIPNILKLGDETITEHVTFRDDTNTYLMYYKGIDITLSKTSNTASSIIKLTRGTGTPSSPSYPLSNNYLGVFGAGGHGTGELGVSASLIFQAAEDFTTLAHGTNIHLSITPIGSTITAKALTILHNKNVGIGTTNPLQKLDVAGKIALDGTTIAYRPTDFTGTLILGDGGVSLTAGEGNEGKYNTFVGIGAGNNNTTGSNNTANGYQSLFSNTTGNNNTANGYYSLYLNTTGSSNTANGYYSLYYNTTGYRNTANGTYSLRYNTEGSNNTANGYTSLYSNTTGSQNTANGYQAGRYIANGGANETGSNSLFLGYDTRANADGETNQIVIGSGAIGNGSNSVTLGNDNIVTTVLKGNVGIGTSTPGNYKLYVNGDFNTESKTAFFHMSNEIPAEFAIYSSADGENAFSIDNNDKYILLGEGGGFNVGIGTTSPKYILDVSDESTGSIFGLQKYQNTTGYGSWIDVVRGRGTVVGRESLIANDVIGGFVFYGYLDTGKSIGSYIASYARSIQSSNVSADLRFYTRNTLDSLALRMHIATSGNVGIGITDATYQLQLSTNSAAKPTSSSWTIASDYRVKTDVMTWTEGLNTILGIRPVTYRYNGAGGVGYDDTTTENIGIIAQELETIAPYMVETRVGTINGLEVQDFKSFNAHALPFLLVNAVKELHTKDLSQDEEIALLKTRVLELENQLK